MDASVYTLLIVESPTIAGIIQNICPPSVYVMATDGFCWRPKYDPSTHQIKAIADPEKLTLRKELKEQSKIASSIVVASDLDASGDFIAWSLSRYIKSSNLKRGQLQSLSKEGIYAMLSDTTELDENQLETRLKNRFLIQQLWSEYADVLDIQLAGLISMFGNEANFRSYLDENQNLFKSTRPLQSRFGEWITVRKDSKNDQFRAQKPLSTFDVLEYIYSVQLTPSFHDAQLLLNQLFQTVLPFSEESLINYPRTSAQAFYSDTWTQMRKQYLKIGSVNDLKPTYLQEIADNDEPHESIHPIDLSIHPDSISGELPKNVGLLYRWIYYQTLKTLSMPEPIENMLVNELQPDVGFYSETENTTSIPETIHPCVTVNELGIRLHAMGVVKPSNFGKAVDDWISKEWIELNNQTVIPGSEVLKQLDKAGTLHSKLTTLNRLKEESSLKPETVKEVITS